MRVSSSFRMNWHDWRLMIIRIIRPTVLHTHVHVHLSYPLVASTLPLLSRKASPTLQCPLIRPLKLKQKTIPIEFEANHTDTQHTPVVCQVYCVYHEQNYHGLEGSERREENKKSSAKKKTILNSTKKQNERPTKRRERQMSSLLLLLLLLSLIVKLMA